ncbi:hypothetical protein L3Y34_016632 [Caenorhabditis briggsae]|uniref:Uncharacterized protein n=1 Tax=Caenorhabditis briggsae TaxID=6238 RepID=A0AAE9DXX6_CAEBR|nr:hypothetical protein L3Y34_016632 [Caenorhabditis briggsae]
MLEEPPILTEEEAKEILDGVSFFSLEFDDIQGLATFMLAHARQLPESEYVIEVFRRYCYGVVRCVEVDRKCSKRFIPNFISSIQHLKDAEKVIQAVYEVLLSLPMMLQARWDLLTMLASSRMIEDLDEVLFKEVMSCSPDQDLATRCSSTMLQMAANPKTSEKAAEIVFRGLTSPIFATRNNVTRSWLCRIINMKSSQKCIEKVLELCREEVIRSHSKMWPVAFREISGLTCVDLQWKPVLEEEPYDTLTFALMGYFSVLLALKHSSSQVHVKLKHDDVVVAKGIEFLGAICSKQAFTVCSKYKIYPPNLERAVIMEMTSPRNPDIYDIIDEDMVKSFSSETQMHFTKEKLKWLITQKQNETMLQTLESHRAEILAKMDQKFYPAEDDGSLRVEINLHTELAAQNTLKRFLNVQHPTEEYPSVAAVMEHLSLQNIDERLYCQKINKINDTCREMFRDRKFSRKVYTEIVFAMITKIPLRSVVDYVGTTIKEESKKEIMIREKIFKMACDLMILDDENARPLSLYHCFIATCYLEPVKVTEVWNICRSLKSGIKKRKMAEMLSKVVTSSEIRVETDVLHDIIVCCLGIHPFRFDIESTQLFVAAVSKLLAFRNESERIMLFEAIADQPEILDLIQEILCHSADQFSSAAFQMVLFFFTRFHVGAIEFYPEEHLRTISQIVNFCHWSIRKFAGETMMLSIAIDAICGFLPWSYLREKALLKDGGADEIEDPVEKLIVRNLRHNRFCVLLSEHDKDDVMMTIEDFELLPQAQFIVEILKNKDKGKEPLNALAQKLAKLVVAAKSFEEIHAVWLAYGLLSDKAVELIEEAEKYKGKEKDWKLRYPSRTLMDSLVDAGAGFHTTVSDLRMANSWLDKGLGKIQILTDKKFCLEDCPP